MQTSCACFVCACVCASFFALVVCHFSSEPVVLHLFGLLFFTGCAPIGLLGLILLVGVVLLAGGVSLVGCASLAGYVPNLFKTMSMIDSKAVFEKRVAELGLKEIWPQFAEFGWDSYGAFAFAAPMGAGGAVLNEEFLSDIVRPLFKLAADAKGPPKTASVRRLFVEAHALAIGDLKAKTERTEDAAPRRLPQAEREVRRKTLDERLGAGFSVSGDFEPAHFVVDRVVDMVETERVEWISWDKVAARKAELKMGPVKRKWSADASGALRETTVREHPEAAVNTHWEINQALRRRSVALDMGGLMSFEAHERLTSRFMRALTEQPGDTAYSPPSVERVRAADVWVWERLASLLARGLRPELAGATLPADTALDTIMGSMEFELKIAPLPRALGGGKRAQNKDDGSDDVGDMALTRKTRNQRKAENKQQQGQKQQQKQLQDMQRELAFWRSAASSSTSQIRADAPAALMDVPRGGGNGSKNGGKGKGKGTGQGYAGVPKALEPGVGRLPNGEPICFAFNLGECSSGVAAGGRCPRGHHVCTRIGCQRAHRASERRK